jgi:hypothetical protein
MTNRSPRNDGEFDSPSRDEVLKRMLKMKPTPHKRDLADKGKIARQKPADPPKKSKTPKPR